VRPEWKAIMNTDVEDLLREGMERFTADLRAPAGLARWVARRRRRRLALRSMAGAAAALTAGAVALVVAGGLVATGGPAAAAAYVVKRADSALTTADPAAIAQMTVTTRGAAPFNGKTVTTTAEEWSYGDQWRSVTYSSPGHAAYDEGTSASGVYTLVNYQTRTWARQPGLGRPAAQVPAGFGPRGCGPVVAALPVLFQPGLPGIGFSASSPPATVARALRAAISCGTLTVAGRQRVDGVEAIELTSRRNSFISETIWVSPGTYLPVRIVVMQQGLSGLQQTADITWLPLSGQNLAKLTVPIPAGYRKVPLLQALLLNVLPFGPSARLKAFCRSSVAGHPFGSRVPSGACPSPARFGRETLATGLPAQFLLNRPMPALFYAASGRPADSLRAMRVP
jgi:hypothetical protein